MARGINKAIIIGNVGQEPKFGYIPGTENAVANISVATSDYKKGRDGNKEEITEWHRVVLFGKMAEIAKQFVKKGSKIYLEGKIKTRSWKDAKDNTTKFVTEIIADSLEILDKRGFVENPQNSGAIYENTEKQKDEPEFDDDIPF